MEFEWDGAKSDRNQHTRGLSFADAAMIFEGPTVETADSRRAYGEIRVKAIGRIDLRRDLHGQAGRAPNYFRAPRQQERTEAMAIVRKSLDELRSERRTIDRAKIAAATEGEIRRQAIEDGEDPDAPFEQFELVIPVHAVRRKLGMSQAQFARAFGIPIGTIRNWEQNRVKPDPAARALLTILYRQPEAALKAIRAA